MVNYRYVTVTRTMVVGRTTVTTTIPVTQTVPVTKTVTSTTTIPGRTTTVTQTMIETVTRTQTVTKTQIITTTLTTTTTTAITSTTTVTKPSWLIDFYACYSIDNYIYVYGYLDKSVNKNAEYIPYVVKYFKCNPFSCSLISIKPFAWADSSTIVSMYGPVTAELFTKFKVEVWSE